MCSNLNHGHHHVVGVATSVLTAGKIDTMNAKGYLFMYMSGSSKIQTLPSSEN